jgi:hypothetical protein
LLARSQLLVPGKIIVAGSWQDHALARFCSDKITVDDSVKNHYCCFLARSLLLVPGKIMPWSDHR